MKSCCSEEKHGSLLCYLCIPWDKIVVNKTSGQETEDQVHLAICTLLNDYLLTAAVIKNKRFLKALSWMKH